MLSQKAKYALQALSYLADHFEDDIPVLINTVAKKKNIPVKFLESILLELKNHNILTSFRGRAGGYKLNLAPKDISLARVIRVVDGPIALLSCVSLNFYKKCDNCDEITCGINAVMKEARDAILNILEHKTLQDIVDRNVSLVK